MTGRMRDRLLLAGWLLVVWVLLWGMLTPGVLLSGLLVAPLCLAASRLPAVRLEAVPRPGPALKAVGGFGLDVARSSAEVVWAVLRRGPQVRSAILALPLPSLPDAVVAAIANRISLVPGTLVVDIDRPSNLLYVYVFDVQDEEGIEAARQSAERAVTAVVAAAGHRMTERGEG